MAAAASAGRSTTRLVLSEAMRRDMVAGLRTWRDEVPDRDRVVDRVDHDGWSVELRRAPLGVVGFVFEGRPNVFADACGVVRSGNTVVFRIGSDALGTARAIVEHALRPGAALRRSSDRARCSSSSRANAAQGTRCSTIGASRSRSPAARVRRSPNSGPWPRRPARR